MRTYETIAQLRQALNPARRAGHRIGFVPTMGALHEGHWSLVSQARRSCDEVVVSIFVNPLQFGPGEDMGSYPQTLERDLDGCARHGCDRVFTPSPRQMYPDHTLTRVAVRRLGEPLCGQARKGHFEGVATVVCKLFNVVGPDAAFFGEKDFQQLVIIRRMAHDLNMPVEIVGCPTVREPDGLAVSSRNVHLDADQRSRATSIAAALGEAAEFASHGQREVPQLIAHVRERIAQAGPVQIEYVEVVDPETLEALEVIDQPARMCVAAKYGSVRLIDNMPLDVAGEA
ncbi:MAG: pantoate--beta-alanine ligase [Phycisphaerae bacterium]|nr:pantoate--beta-alanine ligase [Phycisphaerae bacterium]